MAGGEVDGCDAGGREDLDALEECFAVGIGDRLDQEAADRLVVEGRLARTGGQDGLDLGRQDEFGAVEKRKVGGVDWQDRDPPSVKQKGFTMTHLRCLGGVET